LKVLPYVGVHSVLPGVVPFVATSRFAVRVRPRVQERLGQRKTAAGRSVVKGGAKALLCVRERECVCE